jgi:hypothetical protein
VRIRDLENDLQRTRASLDAQLALLPASGGSSGAQAAESVALTLE